MSGIHMVGTKLIIGILYCLITTLVIQLKYTKGIPFNDIYIFHFILF